MAPLPPPPSQTPPIPPIISNNSSQSGAAFRRRGYYRLRAVILDDCLVKSVILFYACYLPREFMVRLRPLLGYLPMVWPSTGPLTAQIITPLKISSTLALMLMLLLILPSCCLAPVAAFLVPRTLLWTIFLYFGDDVLGGDFSSNLHSLTYPASNIFWIGSGTLCI